MPRSLLYISLFLGMLLVALLFMPLRLAADMAGLEDSNFSAKKISGSIWNGRIDSAKLGAISLGDFDASMQFLPLLAGAAKFDIARDDSEFQSGISATIGKDGNMLLVEDLTTTFRVGQQLAPLPASDINLDGVNVAFASGRCQSASGTVRLSLDANIPGLDLQRGLLGNAECQDGVLVLPMVSGSGMEQLMLKLDGEGFYSARLSLSGGDGAWALLLPTLGFRKTPEGYAMTMSGTMAGATAR